MSGRPPLAYASRGVDHDHLTALSVILPVDLVDRVKARATVEGLTVDQMATMILTIVLPRMISMIIRGRVEHAAGVVVWPTRWVDETADIPPGSS